MFSVKKQIELKKTKLNRRVQMNDLGLVHKSKKWLKKVDITNLPETVETISIENYQKFKSN